MCVENVRDVASEPDVDTRHTHRWSVAAASVCGSSHEKLGTVCQDAHNWIVRSDGVLVAAVADGAGSAKHSDVGANIACRTAVETLCAELDLAQRLRDDPEGFRYVLLGALEGALGAVSAEADVLDIRVRELASTLIVVVGTPHRVVVAQIGDGAVVVADPSGELIALTTPDSGEYINQTTFLISPGALDTAQMHFWEGRPAHLAIFSDGLQMLALAMPFGKPHTPFFSPLFRFHAAVEDRGKAKDQLASFLGSARVRERTDDDVTLMLATLTDCAHATGSQI